MKTKAPKQQPFDWKNPDYGPILAERVARLKRLRANRGRAFADLKLYYKDHPAQFISDWGVTFDPRNVERELPTLVPFVLFRRQEEWVSWLLERWKNQEPGITEKSRESGMSWLSVATACTLCLFNRGMVIGFGSRKEEYVDKIGNPKSIFEKARMFLSNLPAEFLDGWSRDRHANYMRILFPGTGSAMTGESGDGIGRGDRTSLYFVDEAAFLEHPRLVDASLSATTNCRQDISTPNGMANSFAQRRHSGRIRVFTFSWRDDPRKGQEWYAKQLAELDPVVVAGEINIDYAASVENALIPMPWIQSAIGAHTKLGIRPSGVRRGALDIADEGRDLNAFAGRHGVLLESLKSWSGNNRDIFSSVQMAAMCCDEQGYQSLLYDADGMGAGVRGDLRVINDSRKAAGRCWILDEPFRGSASPLPGEMVAGRSNEDFFANLKAMSWWSLRDRFQATHRAVTEGKPVDPDAIISLDPELEELPQLIQELTQPTYSINPAGKVLIDKAPAGFKSPNLADAVCIAFSPLQTEGGFFPVVKGGCDQRIDVEIPRFCNRIFASAAAGIYPPYDALTVVYFAATCWDDRNAPLVVLDWDLQVIRGGIMPQFVASTYRRLDELAIACKSFERNLGSGLGIEAGGFGQQIHDYAASYGCLAEIVDPEKITKLPLAQRAAMAAQFMRDGHVVLTRDALEKKVDFRGTKRNHLISQTTAFGFGQPLEQAGAELLAAFCNGVLTIFEVPEMRDRVLGAGPAAAELPDLGAAIQKMGP